MNLLFILHADQEQNASTSTVRLAGSSGANPFACIASGISSLWGPAHGGANEAVLKMLEEIGDKSEEHTFGLQSPDHVVYRLLLEKKHKLRTSGYEVEGADQTWLS